jgi:CubicO group peptidase (beta-lactamase class C family)
MTSKFRLSDKKLDHFRKQVESVKIDYCKLTQNGHDLYTHARNTKATEKLHKVNSITKSVLSLLVGIAIDRGELAGVHLPLSDFFPELKVIGRSLTVEHLLTMTTGWDWPEWGDWNGMPNLLILSPDWVEFILNRPFVDEPGTRMIYNSGSSHLLSAILHKTTGIPANEYAAKYLFGPLGITESLWHTDASGIVIGGFALSLKAPDIHKLGQLMLGGGQFGEKRVVSEAWIEQAVLPRFLTYEHVGFYGYHWWIMNEGLRVADPLVHFTMGFGGQYLFVIPEAQVVVTFASSLYKQSFLPMQLFKEWLL